MNVTQDTLELIKQAQRNPDDDLAKTIASGTGLVAYDLQAPAKNLYPVVTPIRNVMPRVSGGTGPATNWKQVSALIGSGFDAMGWVPEGQRSGQMSYTTASKSASYVTIGEEDAATYEAIAAGRGLRGHRGADELSSAAKNDAEGGDGDPRGNASLALGTPPTPSLSASGAGGDAARCNLFGDRRRADARRIPEFERVRRDRDDKDDHRRGRQDLHAFRRLVEQERRRDAGGDPRADPVLRCNRGSGRGSLCLVCRTAGSEKLEAITTINSATFSAPLAGIGQPATAITADNSTNRHLRL